MTEPKSSIMAKFQRAMWGNSIARIPISSTVYGGVKGYGSAGRYGSEASRGVSVRGSMLLRSSWDSSLRYFQLRASARGNVSNVKKKPRHTQYQGGSDPIRETGRHRIMRIPFAPFVWPAICPMRTRHDGNNRRNGPGITSRHRTLLLKHQSPFPLLGVDARGQFGGDLNLSLRGKFPPFERRPQKK